MLILVAIRLGLVCNGADGLAVNAVFGTVSKKVYITFDDGPSSYTNEILDILDEYGVKATFFVVAEDTSEREGIMEIVSVDSNGYAAIKTDLPLGSYYLKELSTDEQII